MGLARRPGGVGTLDQAKEDYFYLGLSMYVSTRKTDPRGTVGLQSCCHRVGMNDVCNDDCEI